MNLPLILPGKPAYWTNVPPRHRRAYGYGPRYHDIVTVVCVHPHTAHVRVRRFDGRERLRWVKLVNLRGVE